ncbi:MAG: M1 family aminopeptidase, partial [Actinomycetota bacterium]|nr:M1 family aminopeptidase [Actinomycetota bacterium]
MPSLTRAEAVERAAMLEVYSYHLDLRLPPDGDTFDVTSTIDVSVRQDGSTFLDLAPHALTAMALDGASMDVAALREDRFPLQLSRGRHRLRVESVMAYSHDGEGMHRTVDPADGRTYLYAMTFLDAAPRVFGCFDQPDLKAVFSTHIHAAPEWTVLGNSRAIGAGDGHWFLHDTEPISTYLWTLAAGPYHSISAEHDGITLGVHAVQSLSRELDRDADELFTVTGQAFDAFHELFGIRYPFGDYHQAFVPEFNAGAMENPGCVTLRDSMISRSLPTDAERGQRACTMVHEMAHMWFGDLVTMRWWDDLWLNESFAEYMGHRVTYDATAFGDSWIDFGFVRKRWGLAADQRSSTHPVAGNGATDAASALNDFDGISYAKGAAVLQQLATYLGDDVFLAGVRRHLVDHAYGNAEFADLVGAWEACGAPDLSRWTDAWLRTAGVDTLHWSDGSIVRTPPTSAPVERPHTLTVLTVSIDGTHTEAVAVDR